VAADAVVDAHPPRAVREDDVAVTGAPLLQRALVVGVERADARDGGPGGFAVAGGGELRVARAAEGSDRG
jgi:hypothetical protein